MLLSRALQDMLAVPSLERRWIAAEVDKLAADALPRGVEPLAGRYRDHLRLRIGRFRLLYRVSEGRLTIVAVTQNNS